MHILIHTILKMRNVGFAKKIEVVLWSQAYNIRIVLETIVSKRTKNPCFLSLFEFAKVDRGRGSGDRTLELCVGRHAIVEEAAGDACETCEYEE